MNDFDFFHGEWDVANRRLTAPLSGRPDHWYEFSGSTWCRPLLGGIGNIDEISFPTRGFQGCSLRLYDPETKLWSIHWADSRRGRLDPPVVGSFSGDVGEFVGDDAHEGRPVKLRLRWNILGPDSARWEQAFSTDEGATWETNWVMEFARREPSATHGASAGVSA